MVLLPGDSNEKFSKGFQMVLLDEGHQPVYEGLSYTWDFTNDIATVFIVEPSKFYQGFTKIYAATPEKHVICTCLAAVSWPTPKHLAFYK